SDWRARAPRATATRVLARLAIVSIVGGVVGFAAEWVHRRAGVWVLPNGAGLPFWIIPVYAACLFAAGLAFARVDRSAPRPSMREALIESACFLALFAAP